MEGGEGSGSGGAGLGFGLGGGGPAGNPSSSSFAPQGAFPLLQTPADIVNNTIQPIFRQQLLSLPAESSGQALAYGFSTHYGDTVLE